MAFEGGAKTFLNKGTNNRWQGVLTEADNALYLKRLAEETSPALAAWLEGGRATAGDPRTSAD
jgi:aryl sulfotransferase